MKPLPELIPYELHGPVARKQMYKFINFFHYFFYVFLVGVGRVKEGTALESDIRGEKKVAEKKFYIRQPETKQ